MENKREFKQCKRCKWKWFARQENISVCPKCKSPYWNKEKRLKK